MIIDEYFEMRINELELMRDVWKINNKTNPIEWPIEMDESDWFEQEQHILDIISGVHE